jgi:hypothetical protein
MATLIVNVGLSLELLRSMIAWLAVPQRTSVIVCIMIR